VIWGSKYLDRPLTRSQAARRRVSTSEPSCKKWMMTLRRQTRIKYWQERNYGLDRNSGSPDNLTPNNRKMLISGQICIWISNKWQSSLFLEWPISGPVISHSRNKDGRHSAILLFYLYPCRISVILGTKMAAILIWYLDRFKYLSGPLA
jgi:hypothetical protein